VYTAEFENNLGEECLIQLIPDRDCESPRDWEHLWTWVTTMSAGYSDRNPRYDEKTARYSGSWSSGKWYRPEDFEGEDGELDKEFQQKSIVVPLHLYRHSGDFISVGTRSTAANGNCRWDSGIMGFAFVSKEKLKKEYACKCITKKVIERAMDCLRSEVAAMNAYNDGSVYGVKVVNMRTDAEDSCWGFTCPERKDIFDAAVDMLGGWVDDTKRCEIAERLVA